MVSFELDDDDEVMMDSAAARIEGRGALFEGDEEEEVGDDGEEVEMFSLSLRIDRIGS